MAAKPNSFNKLINLLVLLMLGYAIASSYIFPHKTPQQSAGTGALYEQKPGQSSSLDDWSKLVGVVGHAMQPVLNVVSETKGKGSAVVCGQQIAYQYTDKAIGSDTVYAKDKTVSFRLGSEPIVEGHLRTLADMNEGGERTVQYSSQWGYSGSQPQAGQDLESHIKLISAKPGAPSLSMPYRIFFQAPHSVISDTFRCGQTIKAKFTLWTMDGTQLYPPEKKAAEFLTLTLGQGQAPLGIETVLQKISAKESVTAILPYELTVFFNPGKEPGDTEKQFRAVQFPKNQPILVDIEGAEAISTADAAAPASEPAPAATDAKEPAVPVSQ